MRASCHRHLLLLAVAFSVVLATSGIAGAAAMGDPVPRFKFVLPSQPYTPELNEAGMMLASELKKLGLDVEVATFPSSGGFNKAAGKPFDWGMASQQYVPREDRLEPDQNLGTYHSRLAADFPNYSGYRSPDYDQAIDAEQSELDQDKRRAAIFKAQEIMARDIPFVAMYHPSLTQAYNKAKYTDVISVPGVGVWNIKSFMSARPITGDATYRVGFTGDMITLNPMATTGSFELDVVRFIWDTLGKVQPDGRIAPWMAERWTVVNPTTIRVVLKDGLSFHDGRLVTARDVAFTYSYILKWRPQWYRPNIAAIKDVQAVDDKTIVFNLNKPYGPIFLTFAWIPIIPEHLWKDIVEAQGVKSPAQVKTIPRIGSGPFKFASINPQSIRLARNDAHFAKPQSKEFLWIAFSNRESEFLAMVNQDIYFHEQKGLSVTHIDEAKKYPHLEVRDDPSLTVHWVAFNLRDHSPFRDYTLRHAVAHLMNTESYVKDILKGHGDAGRGMIAPANKLWHNAKIPSKETPGQVHYHQYDPAKAKKILQDAGFSWDKDGRLRYPADYKPKLLPTSEKDY